MHDALTYLATGAALGLTGALSPGPLLALVCVQTLTHGPREGARVGMAPLFTDLPVMSLCMLVLTALSGQAWLMGALSLAGSVVVFRFGLASFKTKPLEIMASPTPARSWRKGVATNLLNPNVWIFWGTVGAPTVLEAFGSSVAAGAGFLAGFYVCLIGAFAAVAWISARCSSFLSGTGYVRTMRVLGVVLILLAARLAWGGIVRLGLA
ncbi:LysE family translocator [Fundidesulfovibrio terrae]|uniref:LysE family translocator n=1 Tax=Fundidesulfovibrio terrae TaxID=2922866 RepID=UPI001FAF1E13|nr:LysE family transporter [Fundidesulfovibrio terrae]